MDSNTMVEMVVKGLVHKNNNVVIVEAFELEEAIITQY